MTYIQNNILHSRLTSGMADMSYTEELVVLFLQGLKGYLPFICFIFTMKLLISIQVQTMNLCAYTKFQSTEYWGHENAILAAHRTKINQTGLNWNQSHVWFGSHIKNERTMAVQCGTWPSASQHHTPPRTTVQVPKTYRSDVKPCCTDS